MVWLALAVRLLSPWSSPKQMDDGSLVADWQPLSVREGLRAPDGPFEGVPDHLREGLKEWLTVMFHLGGNNEKGLLISRVGAAIRVSLDRNPKRYKLDGFVVEQMAATEASLLDAVDACLRLMASDAKADWEQYSHADRASRLRETLELGGSVWTTDANLQGLVRRVEPAAQMAYERALLPSDAASNELATAWGACYGRHPDPSDAWDHAIKAVECVLKPVVSPKNNSATLGTIIRDLKNGKHKFTLTLTAAEGRGVDPLIGLLDLMWPNPDRHGGGHHRVPTLKDAQAVVQLAIMVVQWARDDVLALAGDEPLPE